MKFSDNIDIVIGIPSFNEETTIENVVKTFDDGLRKYYSKKKSLIILLDSSSTDNTTSVFNKINTVTPKIIISNKIKGKGRNIINLLKFSIKNNVQCICMVDADIKNTSADWVKKLLSPILEEYSDFVIPLYKRGKFAGNITNIICRPLIYSLFGLFITQPIGGDFAFNLNYARFLYKKIILEKGKIRSYINEFGIDIFMVYQCISSKYKYCEANLSEKIDKPGFFHMDKIFEEVCMVLFHLISYDNSICPIDAKIQNNDFIIDSKPYSIKELETRKNFATALRNDLKKTMRNDAVYTRLLIPTLDGKITITNEDFSSILANIVNLLKLKKINSGDLNKIIKILRPYFHLRVNTYFDEVKYKNVKDVESALIESCCFLKKKLIYG